ncbi:hypothetical protein [Planctobacterium marinum]|uniref:Uncharacterized protein n=1 Tax=Planctobacterium marinum TaxID=1631968 RepID=A0AA48KTC2_9ALTE|nr:hypothetical protein MACH26_07610 [Planctobacterium marinum]
MQNNGNLKSLQEKLRHLMGTLQQKPGDMGDVRRLTKQLQQVVSDVDQLKQRLSADN